jgi:ribosomal protein S18 acetylase RimI-like enzyme
MHDLQSHEGNAPRVCRGAESAPPTAQIRTVIGADQGRAVALIVSAFTDDPAARWMYPDPQRYAACFPDFVNAFGGRAFSSGSAHILGDVAAALWLPPGTHPDDEAVESLIRRSTPPEAHDALFAVFEQMGRYHPAEPHWHLPLIGVHPGWQRTGYGAALLRHALAAVDAQALPAYLESSNPENIPLYERHGFAVLGVIQVGASPPITPMLRPPRQGQ